MRQCSRGIRKYLLRIYMGRHPDTGKRKYTNRTVNGTKKQAEKALTKMLRARDTGTLVEPPKMSLDTLLDKWLETAVKPRTAERTYRDYKGVARRYIRPALGDYQLSQVSPAAVQELYASMTNRGLSPRTVRHVQNVLHNAFEQAIRWQLVTSNPTVHIDLPRQEHKEMKVMSEEEATLFLQAARGDRHPHG